ncbi:MAG: hypothetical protein ACTSRI_09820 [Promethearchaeota archaeon]
MADCPSLSNFIVSVSLEAWAMPADFSSLFLFDNITITKNCKN